MFSVITSVCILPAAKASNCLQKCCTGACARLPQQPTHPRHITAHAIVQRYEDQYPGPICDVMSNPHVPYTYSALTVEKTNSVVKSMRVRRRVGRSMLLGLLLKQWLKTWMKYSKLYWYMGSMSGKSAMTKYRMEPRCGSALYFSLARLISASVCCASLTLLDMTSASITACRPVWSGLLPPS